MGWGFCYLDDCVRADHMASQNMAATMTRRTGKRVEEVFKIRIGGNLFGDPIISLSDGELDPTKYRPGDRVEIIVRKLPRREPFQKFIKKVAGKLPKSKERK